MQDRRLSNKLVEGHTKLLYNYRVYKFTENNLAHLVLQRIQARRVGYFNEKLYVYEHYLNILFSSVSLKLSIINESNQGCSSL